ncbi:hypothetical protein HK102_000854 [Quaeritorhiza haematococci]|nr:hypothetical protein HK102_000854 [Quaeritorhiza haematococci]
MILFDKRRIRRGPTATPSHGVITAASVWNFQFAVILLSCLLLFPRGVFMVKKHDFKRCDQSGFCTRQRAYADLADKTSHSSSSPYALLSDTLKFDAEQSTVFADVHDTQRKVTFGIELNILAVGGSSTARLRMREKPPLKPRYEVAEFALVAETLKPAPPKGVNIQKIEGGKSGDEWKIVFGDRKQNVVKIAAEPFAIEFFVDDQPVMQFNERGYLYYEHLRNKDEPQQVDAGEATNADTVETAEAPALENQAAPESGDVPVPEKTDEEKEIDRLKELLVKDMWEESFGGKVDSKPNGPSSIGIDLTFPGSSHLYGIPEHAASFNLKNTRGLNKSYDEPFRLYNFDVFEYELDSPMALYGAVPYLMAHRKGMTVGVVWVNSAEMWVDVERTNPTTKPGPESAQVHWMTESGILDMIFLLGPTPHHVLDQLTTLSGRPTMPQSFAIAYHQCRWNYLDETDVEEVDAGFEEHGIPYDVLWLDIEHTDGKKYFTWDDTKFPTPVRMQDTLGVKGRKMVTINDPHIKKDDSYFVSKEAREKNLFVKDKDGKDFDGWCWPGSSEWIDYTNPEGRKYWANLYTFEKYTGSTPNLYSWNDMNEPSVFSGPEITMPKDNLHHGGWEHRDVHNVYGMLQQRSTFEGQLLRAKSTDRPFVLSRAFFLGVQRYGPIWTGDNFAQWDHLEASVPMLLTLGMSGVPFVGADVGGFFNNPSAELLTRWYQLAAFQPFYRGHAHIDTKRREPWLFGEPYTELIKEAIRGRYRILPYMYGLHVEARRKGVPVMRPMMLEFSNDVNTFAMDDQFMLGPAMLIKPVAFENQQNVDVYLPGESLWYDYKTFTRIDTTAGDEGSVWTFSTPLDSIPVLLRGGHIVPQRERVRRASSLMKGDPITLVVALDEEYKAEGTLYFDDGKSYAHESGEYVFSQFFFERSDSSPSTFSLKSKGLEISEWTPSAGAGAVDINKRIESLSARIERIVLIAPAFPEKGTSSGWTTTSAKVVGKAGDGASISKELVVESVVATDGSRSVVTVVKDPGVWVGREWSVEFGVKGV